MVAIAALASATLAAAQVACRGNGGSRGGDADEAPAQVGVRGRGEAVRAGAAEGMIDVPGGTFAMGTDSSDLPAIMERTGVGRVQLFAGEIPRHEVRVEPFRLAASDVTNAEFLAFVRADRSWSADSLPPGRHNGRYLEHWIDGAPAPGEERRPVTFVTWQAAVAYCDWRGARLPTEAEWEWAAAGGDAGAEYPWGQEPPSDDKVSWSGDGIDHPVDVASYPPNGYGLHDMAGNVWKFLADEATSYPEVVTHHVRVDPDTAERVESRRAVRGGSYGAAVANLRIRYRDSHRPRDAREMVGFRCAADVL
jgi:formylglycine-generating enzyme required for sulfatase activity